VGWRDFQHDYEWQEHDDGLRTKYHCSRSLGDYRVPARITAQPKRKRGRCARGPARRIGQTGLAATRNSHMSQRSETLPMPEGEYLESSRFSGLSFVLGIVGIIALVLCVVGAFVSPHQFSYSWLFAFAFFFTLCAGCFFWTIVHHATDADWSVVVRRQL